MTNPNDMNQCAACLLPMADTYQKAEYVKPLRGLCLLFKLQSDKGKGKGQGKIQSIDDEDGLQWQRASESAYAASCEGPQMVEIEDRQVPALNPRPMPGRVGARVGEKRSMYLSLKDFMTHGYSDGCTGCIQMILWRRGFIHNAACRKRMETAIKTTDPDRWARYLLRRGIMGEMDQKSTSEIMGKSDDTSEKGSDWRGYMDEERNRIGGATGMGRPLTASCEGAMGINDTIALEEDAACTATPVRRQLVVSNLRRSRWYWKNEAKRLRAALEKEQRKENVDPKPRGQRIAVQKTSTKPRGKQSAVQKASTKRTGKQSAQDKGKDKDKGKDDDPQVATGAMASVPDVVMRPGVAANAIVAAPDEAFPWWRHPCPPEILSQGKGSRAYQNWWMKRYRAKRKAEFLRAVKQRVGLGG